MGTRRPKGTFNLREEAPFLQQIEPIVFRWCWWERSPRSSRNAGTAIDVPLPIGPGQLRRPTAQGRRRELRDGARRG